MAKNPILQKKFEEGRLQGRREGIAQATAFLYEKFKKLEDVPGIGPKTLEKVKDTLGRQYFD